MLFQKFLLSPHILTHRTSKMLITKSIFELTSKHKTSGLHILNILKNFAGYHKVLGVYILYILFIVLDCKKTSTKFVHRCVRLNIGYAYLRLGFDSRSLNMIINISIF